MKQFITIVFGGLVVIFGALAFIWGSGRLVEMISKERPVTRGDTEIDGITKTIRYTANEEEDVIDSAVGSLPSGIPENITARSYIVRNLTKDTNVAEYDALRLMPVASLTKLATAEVSKRYIPAYAEIEITPQIIATFGNTASFRRGEKMSAADLLYPLLMVSSNDAAEALARRFGRADFVRAMNEFAQSIGAYRTYFADPSGLSPVNVSTATDIALIMSWILEHDPSLINITSIKSKTLKTRSATHTWVNPAHFLSWSYYLGGKNGYIDESGRTSASLFRLGYDKDVYVIVLLDSKNRDLDVLRLINRLK